MVFEKSNLARDALSLALNIRAKNNIELWVPLCIYDLVEKLNIELIFSPIASMEGLYTNNNKPIIVLSSLRPPGRQVFTCAHELGHHFYNHRFKIDEMNYTNNNDNIEEEFLANVFAGFLLMPKIAINNAFSKRKLKIKDASPIQFYTIAKNFGVGYSTLISHMYWGLKLISQKEAKELLKSNPQKLRKKILNQEINSDLFIVDKHWNGRPIDICIDDLIMIDKSAKYNGNCLKLINQNSEFSFYKGNQIGIGQFAIGEKWSSFIRVSRKEYEGRNIYRHLEE